MKTSYRQRTMEPVIRKVSDQFPVVLVTGARQVGKTTFLRHLSEGQRTYVTLDDPLALNLAKEDPALFLQRFTPPVLIDEIQYAPELLPLIKLAVDRQSQPGWFWLTGSQPFEVMKGVSESLAGRVGVLHLLGLSRRELMGEAQTPIPFLPGASATGQHAHTPPALGLKELYQLIWRGAYPAMALNPGMDRDLFYGSYVQTYLQRDVRQLAQVGDEMVFLRFLRVAAARTGQLINMAQMARDADVAPNTAKNWLSILKTSGVIHLLAPYHTNLTKRLVKTPKLYFLDTGLCAYLTGWSSPETLEAGAMSGAILETWVITELLKSYWHHGREAPFFFYRDKDQTEIDLLIVQDGTLHPIEIKKTASPSQRDARPFHTLRHLGLPVAHGNLLCLVKDVMPLSATVNAMPMEML